MENVGLEGVNNAIFSAMENISYSLPYKPIQWSL